MKLICSRRFCAEGGSSLIEFSITLPLSILLFLGMLDLSSMLYDYFRLSQIAREGVKTLAETPMLTEGSFSGSGAANTLTHMQARERMLSLISRYNLNLNGKALDIKTAYSPLQKSGSANSNQDLVSVDIHSRYDGYLPVFRNFPINVSATSGYLFDKYWLGSSPQAQVSTCNTKNCKTVNGEG
ncbi:MAG: pilus assembly protein [Candidatus Dadabacteria bacterium]|nr:MAG: pilus assembly protein [Candidatus Dadabacteria bacterium]